MLSGCEAFGSYACYVFDSTDGYVLVERDKAYAGLVDFWFWSGLCSFMLRQI